MAAMASKEADDPLLARFRKMSKPIRVVYGRPRTFISVLIGIIAFFLLPGSLRLVTRLLIAWDIFIAVYLLLVYIMMFRCGLAHIRRNAILQDDGRFLTFDLEQMRPRRLEVRPFGKRDFIVRLRDEWTR